MKHLVRKLVNFSNPLKLIRPLGSRELLNWLPDEIYLKLIYRAKLGKKLNLQKPKLFNEKLQWLKLYNRKEEYIQYVDKYSVRSFVEERIGVKYLNNLISTYNSVEEIDWANLPEKFVLKCTHGSGTNIICTDKQNLDIVTVQRKLNNWINRNWYWYAREWPYKNIKPRIICEEYLEDSNGNPPVDYKFFCFNGEPKFIQVDIDIHQNHRRNYYDLNWNFLNIEINYPSAPNVHLDIPEKLDEMIEISKRLSKDIPFVRVDLYNQDENIIFGEMTFFHDAGLGIISPSKLSTELGKLIQLPYNKKTNLGDVD